MIITSLNMPMWIKLRNYININCPTCVYHQNTCDPNTYFHVKCNCDNPFNATSGKENVNGSETIKSGGTIHYEKKKVFSN